MSIPYSTEKFERAHLHKPRGTGQWAFFFNRATDPDKAFWHHGPYREAKAEAIAEAKRRGKVWLIEVGS